MVRFIPDDGAGPIQLLGKHESGHLMRKRGIGERPSLLRSIQNTSAEAESSPNDKTDLWGRVDGMILEIARQISRLHASTGPCERHDLGALGQSSEKMPEQFYLLKMIYSDGHIRESEKKFLRELRDEATEITPDFEALLETVFEAHPTNWAVD